MHNESNAGNASDMQQQLVPLMFLCSTTEISSKAPQLTISYLIDSVALLISAAESLANQIKRFLHFQRKFIACLFTFCAQ